MGGHRTEKTYTGRGDTAHNLSTAGWLAGWLAQSVIIVPLRGSILQAETCQILSLSENPRWSPSVAIGSNIFK